MNLFILKHVFFILLMTFLSFSTASALEPKSCQTETFSEVRRDSKPKYWAQMMIRPKDSSLFLSNEEIKRSVNFAINEPLTIDFGTPELSSLYWRGELKSPDATASYQHGYGDHVTGNLSLISSSDQTGILPHSNSKVWHFQEFNYENAFIKILNYNESAPDDKKIRVVSSNAPIIRVLLPEVENLLKRIDEQGDFTILMPIGNSSSIPRGEKLEVVEKLRKYKSVMLIGAISSNYQSAWSGTDYHENVSLASPSEGSEDMSGVAAHSGRYSDKQEYSGSCGAQGLSSGALAAIQKVNPNINARIMRAIIKATALKNRTSVEVGFGTPNVPLATVVARKFNFTEHHETDENILIEKIEMWLKDHLAKQAMEKLSNDMLLQSSSCIEYARKADRLLNQFFLSDGHRFYKSELCKMYIDQELSWGIKNYCEPKIILEELGKDEFINDFRLYKMIAEHGLDIFESKEVLKNVLLQIVDNFSLTSSNEFHEHKVVFKRDILNHKEVVSLFPGLVENWKKILK
jgi:hypothetical protein